MAYRNIFISNPARISVRNEQLIVFTDVEHSIPIEDIETVLIESEQAAITTHALSELARKGICIFVCDEKHIPCGYVLPFNQHSRQLAIQLKQVNLTKPFKKQLWKQIVERKIANQSRCLEFNMLDGCSQMNSLLKRVHSGDPENVEGTAAAFYFKSLFGQYFRRDYDNITNASLNYGYAILRGVIARHIAVYGFLPAFGIHHCSELNPYNLADDFIEPFRPIVDLYVSQNISDDDGCLSKQIKADLFNLLNCDIMIADEKCTVEYAAERMIKSFVSCCKGERNDLYLPVLLPLKQHEYE